VTRALAASALLLTLAACGTTLPAGTTSGYPEANKKPAPAGPPPPPMPDEPIVCPTDVRQCPDGSFVSRDPANECVFDGCPDASKQ
jgi:hypothetical protein